MFVKKFCAALSIASFISTSALAGGFAGFQADGGLFGQTNTGATVTNTGSTSNNTIDDGQGHMGSMANSILANLDGGSTFGGGVSTAFSVQTNTGDVRNYGPASDNNISGGGQASLGAFGNTVQISDSGGKFLGGQYTGTAVYQHNGANVTNMGASSGNTVKNGGQMIGGAVGNGFSLRTK